MLFTVFVLTRAGQDFQDLLAPYQLYEDGRGPYAEWRDHTEEWRARYEHGETEAVERPDGTYRSAWDPELYVSGVGWPEDRVTVPVRLVYPSFDRFVRAWFGGEGPNAEGRYGRWQNPNGQWDWYSTDLFHPFRYHPEGRTVFPIEEWQGDVPEVVVTPDGEWHEDPHWWDDPPPAEDVWEGVAQALISAHPGTLVQVVKAHS